MWRRGQGSQSQGSLSHGSQQDSRRCGPQLAGGAQAAAPWQASRFITWRGKSADDAKLSLATTMDLTSLTEQGKSHPGAPEHPSTRTTCPSRMASGAAAAGSSAEASEAPTGGQAACAVPSGALPGTTVSGPHSGAAPRTHAQAHGALPSTPRASAGGLRGPPRPAPHRSRTRQPGHPFPGVLRQ